MAQKINFSLIVTILAVAGIGLYALQISGKPTADLKGLGVIKGKVSVGPICPVERIGQECKAPPEAYTSREVNLYANDGRTLVKKMNFNPDGTYLFKVPAGTYVLDIPRQGIGGAKELPKTISVKAGEAVEINFSIDTGIR